MLPINERNRRVFFPFYFDALKIPLISIKKPEAAYPNGAQYRQASDVQAHTR